MLSQCVVGVFDSVRAAETAVEGLERAGLFHQTSLVTRDITTELSPRDRQPISHGDASLQTGAQGAAAGGLVGFLLGTPLLAVPGLGLVLIAGPIAAGLTGAIVGGFLGAMSGWGVKPDRVAEYQELVRAGSPLVVVSGDPEAVSRAKGVLDRMDAQVVNLHATTGEICESDANEAS